MRLTAEQIDDIVRAVEDADCHSSVEVIPLPSGEVDIITTRRRRSGRTDRNQVLDSSKVDRVDSR